MNFLISNAPEELKIALKEVFDDGLTNFNFVRREDKFSFDTFRSVDVLVNYLAGDLKDTDLAASIELAKSVALSMRHRNEGHILNIAMDNDSKKENFLAGAILDTVASLTESLRMDLFGTNIRVSFLRGGSLTDPRVFAFWLRSISEQPRHVNIQSVILADVKTPPISVKQRIWITGATSGIGEATAKLFARKGYSLALVGRSPEKLRDMQEGFKKNYACDAEIVILDIRDKNTVAQIPERYADAFSSAGALINSAGSAKGWASFDQQNLSDWNEVIETNFFGTVNLSNLFIDKFSHSAGGGILTIGSIAGRSNYPNDLVYCASKRALDSCQEAIFKRASSRAIRSIFILPGVVRTSFVDRRHGNKNTNRDLLREIFGNSILLNPDDIADLIFGSLTCSAGYQVKEMTVYPTDQVGVFMFNKRAPDNQSVEKI